MHSSSMSNFCVRYSPMCSNLCVCYFPMCSNLCALLPFVLKPLHVLISNVLKSDFTIPHVCAPFTNAVFMLTGVFKCDDFPQYSQTSELQIFVYSPLFRTILLSKCMRYMLLFSTPAKMPLYLDRTINLSALNIYDSICWFAVAHLLWPYLLYWQDVLQSTPIDSCFIDYEKAFDRVKHEKLITCH